MRSSETVVVADTCRSCGADLTGYKTFCAACGTAIGEKPARVQPPRRSYRTTGSAWWVLVAIGLIIVDGIVNRDPWISLSDWLIAASITLAWLFAALTARKGFGRVILWLILLVNVFVWVVLVGLFTSPALQNVDGERLFIEAMTELLDEVGVSQPGVDCFVSEYTSGGYAQGLDNLDSAEFLAFLSAEEMPPEFQLAYEGFWTVSAGCLSEQEWGLLIEAGG
jgi:hypothetical protein